MVRTDGIDVSDGNVNGRDIVSGTWNGERIHRVEVETHYTALIRVPYGKPPSIFAHIRYQEQVQLVVVVIRTERTSVIAHRQTRAAHVSAYKQYLSAPIIPLL